MNKKALLTDRVTGTTGTVDIEGVGEVTVRGLTRYEMILFDKAANGDQLKQERMILAAALVDPALTEDEVEQWQKVSPAAEINAVAAKVNELSGIGQGASKSDVPPDGGAA